MELKTLGTFLFSKRKSISWDLDEAELKRKGGYSVPQYQPDLGDPPLNDLDTFLAVTHLGSNHM